MKTDQIALALATVCSLACLPGWTESSPGEAYLKLHARERAAAKYEDLTALRSRRSVKQDKPMSKDDTKMFFELFKAILPSEVRVTAERREGAEATVEAVALKDADGKPIDGKTTGVIKLVLENGDWKIDSEKWHSRLGDDQGGDSPGGEDSPGSEGGAAPSGDEPVEAPAGDDPAAPPAGDEPPAPPAGDKPADSPSQR